MSLYDLADWKYPERENPVKRAGTGCGYGCSGSACRPSCSPSCGCSGCSSSLRKREKQERGKK